MKCRFASALDVSVFMIQSTSGGFGGKDVCLFILIHDLGRQINNFMLIIYSGVGISVGVIASVILFKSA